MFLLLLIHLPSPRRLASGEGIVTLGVCVCLSADPRLHAALISVAKVMRCIQYSQVLLCFVIKKVKGQVLDIALLHDEHMLRSAFQSRKWQLIGMS